MFVGCDDVVAGGGFIGGPIEERQGFFYQVGSVFYADLLHEVLGHFVGDFESDFHGGLLGGWGLCGVLYEARSFF